MSLTVGESLYVVEREPLRGPFSLELVPSLGWDWIKLDLGIYATLEELESGGRDLMFRPGVRVTPPVPVYGRAAFNLTATNGFDWGFLLGVGLDIPLIPPLGLIAELDTFLTEGGEFGGRVVPLELKVGARLAF
ncbi:MAG: hypothetical protein AMXMBFR64_54900 [Myxococcales bacterium]